MLEDLPGHRRHPARPGDPLPLDQRHRLQRIPFAHEDQSVAGDQRAHQHRAQSGRVEQRNHQQRRPRLGRLWSLAAPQRCPRVAVAGGEDVGHQIAVASERALGLPRRAAGIEDGGVVVRLHRRLRQVRVGQRRPGFRRPDQVLEPNRPVRRRLGPADDHMPDLRSLRQMRRDPLVPRSVADQQLGARIGQAIFELGAGPPGVERHRDRPQHGDREEGDRPFRQIDHGDSHPVALADAEPPQLRRKRRHRPERSLVADPLVVEDGEQPIAMAAREAHEGGEGRGRVLPHAGRAAVYRHLVHLEAAARRGQQGVDLVQGHARPIGVQLQPSHRLSSFVRGLLLIRAALKR